MRREHREFLESFGPQARAVLDTLLDKFSEHGAEELSARALRVPPRTEMGVIRELRQLFGGRDGRHEAIDDLGDVCSTSDDYTQALVPRKWTTRNSSLRDR